MAMRSNNPMRAPSRKVSNPLRGKQGNHRKAKQPEARRKESARQALRPDNRLGKGSSK
jgi:hypothetical protein